jgi:RNA polymerase sigma-70 factor (ECF subfamily)
MESLRNNDASLLIEMKALITDRNEKAIELLYDHYYDRLCHFAQTFTIPPEIAEEIVEDLFIRLWSKPLLVHNITNLPVYLYRAVKNGALDLLEKGNKMIPTDFSAGSYAVEDSSLSPVEELVLAEMNQALQVVIDALPPRCRLIFTLIREDGLSYKEVAEILGISVNTIDNQMAIAIKRICAVLDIPRKTTFAGPSKRN